CVMPATSKRRARGSDTGSRRKLPDKHGSGSSTPRTPPRQASTQKARAATDNGYGVLRSMLEEASAKIGCSLSDLTVLSTQIDPYRLDTASGHRDGQWVAEQLERLVERDKRIHWRGLHYAIVAVG